MLITNLIYHNNFRKLVFSNPFKKRYTDRTKEYWSDAAQQPIETTMEKICSGFDKETFANKKDSIIFFADIQFNKNDTVLDLACGIGRSCKWVAPLVKYYVGIDFIPEMIAKAREYNKQYQNVVFYTNDGKTLSVIDNNTFDIAYCEIAFQHMLKPIQESYLLEIYRVLKPNGLFYAQIPKLSFFKDKSYSWDDKELESMLQYFNFELLKINNPCYDAYYTVKCQPAKQKEIIKT